MAEQKLDEGKTQFNIGFYGDLETKTEELKEILMRLDEHIRPLSLAEMYHQDELACIKHRYDRAPKNKALRTLLDRRRSVRAKDLRAMGNVEKKELEDNSSNCLQSIQFSDSDILTEDELKRKKNKEEDTTYNKTVKMYSPLKSGIHCENVALVGLDNVCVPFIVNLKGLESLDISKLKTNDLNMDVVNMIQNVYEPKLGFQELDPLPNTTIQKKGLFDMGFYDPCRFLLSFLALLIRLGMKCINKMLDYITAADFSGMDDVERHEWLAHNSHHVQTIVLDGDDVIKRDTLVGRKEEMEERIQDLLSGSANTQDEESADNYNIVPMVSILKSGGQCEPVAIVGVKDVQLPFVVNLEELGNVDIRTLTEEDLNMDVVNLMKQAVETKLNTRGNSRDYAQRNVMERFNAKRLRLS